VAGRTDATPELVAAIDAGSNGMRFAIGRVEADGRLTELEHLRESVRLGADTFTTGTLSPETLDLATRAFERFSGLIKINAIARYRAVATSATRDATNGRDLVARVSERTGLMLEVIDGLEEGALIFAAVAATIDLRGRTALLVDLGGGSIAVTIARDGVITASHCYPLGGVRLLSELRRTNRSERDLGGMISSQIDDISQVIAASPGGRNVDFAVATGGNPEALGKLRQDLLGKGKADKLKRSELDEMIDRLLALTPEQRMDELDLRADRADVIAIAAIVLRAILEKAGVEKVVTPGVGVAQGVLERLAADVREARGGG